MKYMWHMIINAWCVLAANWIPHDPVWLILLFPVMGGNLVLMMRSFIKGPHLTAEQRLEISRNKTAELEKDLGYDPLNLHELDDVLLDNHNRQEKKP